jgi:transposase
MVKCSQDQVKRLKKALQREKDPVVRQRIRMILLREDGKTQPEIAELTGVSLSTVNRAHMAYDTWWRQCVAAEADWGPAERKYDVGRREEVSRSIRQSRWSWRVAQHRCTKN